MDLSEYQDQSTKRAAFTLWESVCQHTRVVMLGNSHGFACVCDFHKGG